MTIGQVSQVTLPYPSTWIINAGVGGRPLSSGILIINSVINNKISGTINFRGTPIPIQGIWDENTKQIIMDSPYARFVGHLTIVDDPQINMRHYVMKGTLIMKPPSTWAGETGSWAATADYRLR